MLTLPLLNEGKDLKPYNFLKIFMLTTLILSQPRLVAGDEDQGSKGADSLTHIHGDSTEFEDRPQNQSMNCLSRDAEDMVHAALVSAGIDPNSPKSITLTKSLGHIRILRIGLEDQELSLKVSSQPRLLREGDIERNFTKTLYQRQISSEVSDAETAIQRLGSPRFLRFGELTGFCQGVGEQLYFILKVWKATDLRKILSSDNLPSLQSVIDIMKELLDQLDVLHSTMKVIHLDLKPENIFLSHSSEFDFNPSFPILV